MTNSVVCVCGGVNGVVCGCARCLRAVKVSGVVENYCLLVMRLCAPCIWKINYLLIWFMYLMIKI